MRLQNFVIQVVSMYIPNYEVYHYPDFKKCITSKVITKFGSLILRYTLFKNYVY